MNDHETQVLAHADAAFESEQFPFFRALVDTPSHTYARNDVEVAAQFLDRQAESLGLGRALHPDPEGRFADHRVFSHPQLRPDEKALLLVGHVDTVFPRSTGFLTLEEGQGDDAGKVFGPGVLDMKSGLSVIFFALRAVKSGAPTVFDALRLRILCNTDEEVGSPSSAALVADLATRTSHAMVFEGGRDEDKIITRRKGGGVFRLVVKGRATHAGNDHRAGINAIHALSLLVPRVEALTDYERGITLNVGLIAGGTAKNTVPDEASCVIDSRFLTVADAEEVVEQLQAIAADPFSGMEVPPRVHGARVQLQGNVTRPPMEASEDSQRVRIAYEACAARVGLGVGEAPLQGGGSDANLLSAAGVPSIDGLGPFGKFFHNPKEWSSLDSLRRRTKALALYLVRTA